MISARFLCFAFLFFIFSRIHAQGPSCQTGPLEGYRGNCSIARMASPDGFVYTHSDETKVIKKWNFATGQIVQEWPVDYVLEFKEVTHDGRYLRFGARIEDTYWPSKLFDTQTGKLVPIENMSLYAILPNGTAVVKDEKRKAMLYDMKSKKTIATLGKDVGDFIDVSDDGNIIFWSQYDGFSVHAYDISKGDEVFESEVNRRNMPASISPDGRFAVWCGGIRDLKAKKTMTMDCQTNNLMYHQMLYAPDGKTGYSISSGEYSEYGAWTSVIVYVREYNLETGAMIEEYRDPFSQHSRMNSIPGNTIGTLASDGSHIYFPAPKGMVLVDKTSYAKQEKLLDIFGNIGSVGLAQEQQKERRTKHIEALTAAGQKTFENITFSGADFQFDIKTSLFDYDPISELALVGNIYEGGLLNIKDGKFITTYSLTVNRPGLSVKTKHQYASYSIVPGGTLVSVAGIEGTSLYNKSAFVKELPGVNVRKLISPRLALVHSKSDMLGLYDINSGETILTYRKWNEELSYFLSPDRSKILFKSNGKAEVVDVLTGKVLRRLDGYSTWITNKYIVTNPLTAEMIDIISGDRVVAKGWDANRSGRNFFIEGNYMCYVHEGGMVDAYDLDKLAYVSDMPAKLIGELTFNYVAAFPNTQKLMICTSNGSPSFGLNGNAKESASAYTMNLSSGEFFPFRFHIPAAEASKIYAARQAQSEQQRAAREAQENAGLDPCMHSLKIKPNRVVINKASQTYHHVAGYDCQSQNYQVTSRAVNTTGTTATTSVVPRWKMESEYNVAAVSVCPKCNGSGTHTHTVNYSSTNVDNYNANVPGGKVITTTSGSRQETETCPVCKGQGVVPEGRRP